MGHTLVAVLSQEDETRLTALLARCGMQDANKIPFGRGCDRAKADAVLPHHITLVSWSKKEDAVMLDRLRSYHFPGNCEILAGEPVLSPSKEGSTVLMLPVTGGQGWAQLQQSVKKQTGTPCQASPHITLAASKDKALLRAYQDRLLQSCLFPLHLTVTGAQLYHIWTPVVLTAAFR